MLVHNPTGQRVSEWFPVHGVVAVEPGKTANVPDDVWASWQEKTHWGDRACPLVPASEMPAPAAPEPKEYVCQECGKTFDSSQKLAAHVRMAHRNEKEE